MEAYENETYDTLNKTTDDERVCVFVSTSDYGKQTWTELIVIDSQKHFAKEPFLIFF
jgi:hypothetical protein